MAVTIQKPIPEFAASATQEVSVSNVTHLGRFVILFFYPKDHTPGCTTEAAEFRDRYRDFEKADATVFGVSRDNMASHDKFKAQLELPYQLIADTEEKMCHMFGVVKNKIMYGKKVKGIERSTFLIDPKGVLVHEWRGVKVQGHVEEVLRTIQRFSATGKVRAGAKPVAARSDAPSADKAPAEGATKTAIKTATKASPHASTPSATAVLAKAATKPAAKKVAAASKARKGLVAV